MKLPELKELAKQMGLRGVSGMRKGELVTAIETARTNQAPLTQATDTAADNAVKPKRTVRAKAAHTKTAQAQTAEEKSDGESKEYAALPAEEEMTQIRTRRVRGKHRQSEPERETAGKTEKKTADTAELLDSLPLPERGEHVRGRRRVLNESLPLRRREAAKTAGDDETKQELDDILSSLPLKADAEEPEERTHRRPRRNERNDRNERGDHNDRSNDRNERASRNDRNEHEDRPHRRNRADRDDRNERNDRNDRNDNANERRGRNDDRNTRDNRDNTEDLVEVGGIVDVLDSYAFIRTSGYLPGPNDIYVSMGQIKKYGLRKGDAVRGYTRAPHEGDRRNQRQKFMPLQSIFLINGLSVEEAQDRPSFSKLTPLYPDERLRMETTPNRLIGRLIDIVSPIGKGQRGLIVSPPKAGKTITLQNIANAITVNNPEVHLMVVLVDERPEEVTDMERTVKGEIISSTFDRPASDHTIVAELAIERAKRLVELGQDVVVLLDSMTRLARAYNIAAPASGRILSGGVDAQALYPPKKFFGAARNIENGGSLTIISSALVETGSKMDEVIFEEFKGTGNMELRLSRELADKRMFPAVDINASGTRREELITNPQELPVIYSLRRLLGGLEPEQAYQTLVPRLKKTMTNNDFLKAIVQQGNNSLNNGNN